MTRTLTALMLAALAVPAPGADPWASGSVKTRFAGRQPGADQPAPPKRWAYSRRHVLLEFAGPAQPQEVQELLRRGIQILETIPPNAFVVSLADESMLAGLDGIRQTVLAANEKVSPLLAPAEGAGESAHTHVWRPAPLIVSFHRDVPAPEARALLREHGVEVREHLDLQAHEFLVLGTPQDAALLAEWDEVAYVYPGSPELAEGARVHACAGASTQFGPVAQLVATVGNGWDGAGLGSARLGYFLGTLSSRLPRANAEAEILKALAEWSRQVQVDFSPAAAANASRSLTFEFAKGNHGDGFPFDGPGKVLAHTFYPAPPNPESIAGDLHFDDEENWGIGAGVDLYSVALHELGHALGLGHSDQPGTVMYPYYSKVTTLTAADVAAIRTLYAARTGTATPTTPETPVTPTTPAPPATPAAPKDTVPPTLVITYPAAANVLTSATSLRFRGTASDNVGVSTVVWIDSLGNTAKATGSKNWETGLIPLRFGSNRITIRATDAAGNAAWRTVVVTRR